VSLCSGHFRLYFKWTDNCRPISSYGALDLPTYFLDLTPFVPILTDGKPHAISLDVASAENNHAINQNWYLSAALQVFTDTSSNPTTGKMTQYSVEPFSQTTTVGSVGGNGDVNVTVSATRKVHIESTITSGSGKVNKVVWDQSLEYNNVQNYLSNTTIQVGEIHYVLHSISLWLFLFRTYVKLHLGRCRPRIMALLLSLITSPSRSPSI
jgi:hypothetical protein